MFAALTKEEVAGREVVAPRRKKGISFTNMIEKCQRRKDYRHVLKNLSQQMQLWSSAAAGLLENIKGTRLVSTSWSSGRRLKDLQCTDKLTLRRSQTITNIFCTGEKSPPPLSSFPPGVEMSGLLG